MTVPAPTDKRFRRAQVTPAAKRRRVRGSRRHVVSVTVVSAVLLSGSYFVAGALPHDHLFPHCAAVIHHGGAGTLDTASRAGCPQIILPQVLDQFWNAHTLTARSVAGYARRPRPKTDEIDMLIGYALSDETRRAARSLAASLPDPARTVQRIVGIIEQTAGNWRAGAR